MFYSFLSRYFFLMPFWENVKYFIKHEREFHKYEHIFIINILLYNLWILFNGFTWLPWWLSGSLPMPETWVWSLGQEDSLEKEMATHSGIFAWELPWTEEVGGIQSGVTRVRHDLVTKLPPPCCYSGALWFGFHNSSLPTPPHRENL